MVNKLTWKDALVRKVHDKCFHLLASEQAVVIEDAFPKSKYHFLVLPLEDIQNVFCLHSKHLPLLDDMLRLAHEIIAERSLRLTDFQIGFHAAPSMNRLHLHVLSKDFVSPCLKRSAHWLINNTALFLTYDDVYEHLKTKGPLERPSDAYVKAIFASPMKCNQCSFVAKNMPTLKQHLQMHDDARSQAAADP